MSEFSIQEYPRKIMPTKLDQYLYDLKYANILTYPNKKLLDQEMRIFNNILDEKGYLLIYSGSGGTIFKMVESDIVIKIIYYYKECDIYTNLPRFERMPYADPRLSHCSVITKHNIFEMIDENIIKYELLIDKTEEEEAENPYYILTMPFLGIDFLNYMWQFSYSHFDRIWVSVSMTPGTNNLTVEIFKNLCNILHEFNIKLDIMHQHNFIHNDIKLNNITFNEDENKLVLIDFDQSQYYPNKESVPLNAVSKDERAYINFVIKQVVYYAIRNKQIYDKIIKTRLLFFVETFKTKNCLKLTEDLKQFADKLESVNDEFLPDNTFKYGKHIDLNSINEDKICGFLHRISISKFNTKPEVKKYLQDFKASPFVERAVLDRFHVKHGLGLKSKKQKQKSKQNHRKNQEKTKKKLRKN